MNWDDLISSTEIAKRAGVSYRMLDRMVWHGRVTPQVMTHGSGTQRMWHRGQIGEIVEESLRLVPLHEHRRTRREWMGR